MPPFHPFFLSPLVLLSPSPHVLPLTLLPIFSSFSVTCCMKESFIRHQILPCQKSCIFRKGTESIDFSVWIVVCVIMPRRLIGICQISLETNLLRKKKGSMALKTTWYEVSLKVVLTSHLKCGPLPKKSKKEIDTNVMKFLRENKRGEIRNWYSDFFKTIGRIQLQIVWPYKSNGWNEDNGKGVRISYFRKETCEKIQYTMAFSAAKKTSRRRRSTRMSVKKSEKKSVGRDRDWRLRLYPLNNGKECRRIIRIYWMLLWCHNPQVDNVNYWQYFR